MISEAITAMKDRTGSSQPAIAKFMEENYATQLPPNFKKILSVQLKKFVKSEKLVKVKNSYKISIAEKVKKPAAAAAVEKKQPSKKDAAKVKEKESAKKVVEKAKRTKRLSQVKTPEAMKKAAAKTGGEKIKKRAATPAKRKIGGTIGATPAAKKAKK